MDDAGPRLRVNSEKIDFEFFITGLRTQSPDMTADNIALVIANWVVENERREGTTSDFGKGQLSEYMKCARIFLKSKNLISDNTDNAVWLKQKNSDNPNWYYETVARYYKIIRAEKEAEQNRFFPKFKRFFTALIFDQYFSNIASKARGFKDHLGNIALQSGMFFGIMMLFALVLFAATIMMNMIAMGGFLFGIGVTIAAAAFTAGIALVVTLPAIIASTLGYQEPSDGYLWLLKIIVLTPIVVIPSLVYFVNYLVTSPGQVPPGVGASSVPVSSHSSRDESLDGKFTPTPPQVLPEVNAEVKTVAVDPAQEDRATAVDEQPNSSRGPRLSVKPGTEDDVD